MQTFFIIFAEKGIMKDANDTIVLLTKKGIRPTPNRVLILKELMRAKSPVSLADLETALCTIDKASIFRVLELFAEKDAVHIINDGSRSLKYEVCPSNHHSIADQHVHFYCEQCGTTYCLEDIPVPSIHTPDTFLVKSVNYMLKGICPKCRKG